MVEDSQSCALCLYGLLFVGPAGYVFLFATNHLGLRRDLSMLSRFFYDNALAFVLFNLLGLFPFITNCLMWPTLRSRGLKVRAWTQHQHCRRSA